MGLFSTIGSIAGSFFGAPEIGSFIGSGVDSAVGSSSVGKAGKQYNSYLQASLDTLKAGGAETEKRLQPTAQIGTDTIGRLNDILVNGDMSKFYDNPAYQYALDQSMRGIQANAAAKGVLMSGNTLKELQKNASGLASQNYGSYITNLQNLFTQADPYLSNYDNLPYQRAQDAANIMIGQGANARDTTLGRANMMSGAGSNGGGFSSLLNMFGGGGGAGSTMDSGWLFSNGSMGGIDLGSSMPWL